MNWNLFPPLVLSEWHPTRDTLNTYAKIVGSVRRALTPPQKHWWHISLQTTARGLTTTPMPTNAGAIEIVLDLVDHQLVAYSSSGEVLRTPLRGQTPARICTILLAALQQMDVLSTPDLSDFTDETVSTYDRSAVERYWQATSQIDLLLKQFKGEQRRETSPVQLWPHHFDLSMVWFSGRLVPGIDPADADNADEQMAFGFSTGDEGISEPYFYVTAYPLPLGLADVKLPEDAHWHTESFTGAVMRYESLVTASDPTQALLDYWRTVLEHGQALMRK